MADSSQGGRSSRPLPNRRKRELRQTIREADRAITRLTRQAVFRYRIGYPYTNLLRRMHQYDMKRMQARNELKGYWIAHNTVRGS